MATVQVQENELPGDEVLRRRFGTPDVPVSPIIADDLVQYLESVEFFFIATSNRLGECDSSFRGIRKGSRAVRVLSKDTLVFPDYLGNGSFRSLGNILENHHIGMLFMDFGSGIRIRINGDAEVSQDHALLEMFPGSMQVVKVKVREIYRQNRPVSIERKGRS